MNKRTMNRRDHLLALAETLEYDIKQLEGQLAVKRARLTSVKINLEDPELQKTDTINEGEQAIFRHIGHSRDGSIVTVAKRVPFDYAYVTTEDGETLFTNTSRLEHKP